jgi:hypothetical protein
VACLISMSIHWGSRDPCGEGGATQLQATACGNLPLLSRYTCSLSTVSSSLVHTSCWALQGTGPRARRESVNKPMRPPLTPIPSSPRPYCLAQGRSARWSPEHHHGAGDYGANVEQLSMSYPTRPALVLSGSRARRSRPWV